MPRHESASPIVTFITQSPLGKKIEPSAHGRERRLGHHSKRDSMPHFQGESQRRRLREAGDEKAGVVLSAVSGIMTW